MGRRQLRFAPLAILAALTAPACGLIAGLGDYQRRGGEGGGGAGGGSSSSSSASSTSSTTASSSSTAASSASSSATSSASSSSGAGGSPTGERLAVGVRSACYLRDDATVSCWGDNRRGQLGYDPLDDSFYDFAMTVPTLSSIAFDAVAMGAGHACAIGKDTHVWCWGDNHHGAVGVPINASNYELATKLAETAAQVITGADFTCTRPLAPLASVRCWGSNAVGSLGYDTIGADNALAIDNGVVAAKTIATCAQCTTACAVVNGKAVCWGGTGTAMSIVSGTLDIADVAVGSAGQAWEDTIALRTKTGEVYGTYRSGAGQPFVAPIQIASGISSFSAGDRLCVIPDTNDALQCSQTFDSGGPPTLLTAPFAAGTTEVRVGWSYKCALTSTGPQCIGLNDIGQLGDGKSEKVAGATSVKAAVKAIFQGPHCTALRGDDDKISVFGECRAHAAPYQLTPKIITVPAGTDSVRSGPAGNPSWDERAYFHDPVSGLYQKVDGVPSPVTDLPTPPNKQDYTTAIITSDFDVGLLNGALTLQQVSGAYNAHGLFGPSAPSFFQPALPAMEGVAAAAFAQHVCAWSSTAIYCWGDNSVGQVDPSMAGGDVTAPKLVTSFTSGVKQVVVGAQHTCALVSGAVHCWGGNAAQQLGSSPMTSGPLAVTLPAGAPTIQRIASGADFTCAAGAAMPEVFCWGNNDYGACGQPVLGPSAPKRIDGLYGNDPIADLTAGAGTACVLTSMGSREVFCWGRSTRGEAGAGQAIDRIDAWGAVSFPQ